MCVWARLSLVGWVLWGSPRKNWQSLLLKRQAYEQELSSLVNCFSLRSLSVSVHYQFLWGGGIIFNRLQLVLFSIPLHPLQAEVKFSLLLFCHKFCPGESNLPTNSAGLCGSLQSRWCISLRRWICDFIQLWDSAGRQHRKLVQAGSGTMNYSWSRACQMPAELVLQFSWFHFCKKRENKWKGWKTDFQCMGRQFLVFSALISGLLCGIKSNFKCGSSYILCTLCIGLISVGKKPVYFTLDTPNLKYFSGIMEFSVSRFFCYPSSWFYLCNL
jgi:hypothetical protein